MAEREESEYEKLRRAHMQRNHEYLVALGLKKAEAPIAPNGRSESKRSTVTPKPRKRIKREPVSCRRSARLKGIAAENYGEDIFEQSQEEENEFEGFSRKKKKQHRDYVTRSEAMVYLKEVREAMLPVVYVDDWHAEAIRRWGTACQATNWQTFVESRLATPPPVSPLDFLQEWYAADAWRLLSCCILMSRVSSWLTKTTSISAFFQKYPTPTSFALETDHNNIYQAIRSLGLFDDRLASLIALTDHFLRGAPLPDGSRDNSFQISTDRNSPYKIRGVGPFSCDSYQLFCKDNFHIALSEGGKPLVNFLNWRRKFDSLSIEASE